MAIGVLEAPRIAAPKGLMWWVNDDCAGFPGLLDHCIHFCLAGHIVADGKFRGARRPERDLRSCAISFLGQIASFNLLCNSKNATAPCSNSVPTMPSVGNPNPSR